MEDIIVSGYRPPRPKVVKVGDYEAGRMEVRWEPSHCAGSYDVIYSPIGGEVSTVQAVESEIVLENLESCQEYEVSVTAILGEEYSDEAKMTFMTNPDPEVNTEEVPLMQVEEKANGSITFVIKSSEVNTMCEVRFHNIPINFCYCLHTLSAFLSLLIESLWGTLYSK